MSIFICDLCDQTGRYDPSLSDDPEPDAEVCAQCQIGNGLAEFYESDTFVGRQRVPAPGGKFPAHWTFSGRTFGLDDSDRMTAVFTAS